MLRSAPIPLVIIAAGLLSVTTGTARPSAQAVSPITEELLLYVNEIRSFAPGYPMGDVVLADPTLAGYEPVNGRRELLIRGKAKGRTTLRLRDQRGALRHELAIVVVSREDERVERDLRELLKPYPSVALNRLGDQLVVSGTVMTPDDLAAVEKIAEVASARSVVRLTPDARGTLASDARTSGPPSRLGKVSVDYEVELLEASSQFQSGNYGAGIEPSGKPLYKGKVTASSDTDGTLFIGGRAVDPKGSADSKGKTVDRRSPTTQQPPETGIRMTLRPATIEGVLSTNVMIETNVPLAYSLYDPQSWRRSRWTFETTQGMPFGLAGADLLAAPTMGPNGSSGLDRGVEVTDSARSLPGVSGTSGLEFVPFVGGLFRSSSYKEKRTQLLVVIRPLKVTSLQ